LGIAAVAHVALFAALWLSDKAPPQTLAQPEAVTVSLATDVSLQSTAPDPSAEAQAAIAPELAPVAAPAPAPEPVPVAEPPPPRPVERTQPAPRPSARPTTRASARPSPTPSRAARPLPAPSRAAARPAPQPTRAAERSGGSRIGADFLEGTSAGNRNDSRGTPAAAFGAAEAASLNSAISRQIRPHWSAPQGVDAELLVTMVRFRLNRDGSLNGRPSCVSQSGETASNATQADLHCERAIRAIQLAAPFDLPDQFYDRWQLVTSRFDRRL